MIKRKEVKHKPWEEFEIEPKMTDLTEKKIMITTDDFSPKNFKYFDYWLKLKENHPKLKLTLFTIPMHDGKAHYNVKRHPDFSNFCYFHRGWITLGVHGLTHGAPPENLGTFDEQVKLLKEAKRIMTWKVPGLTFAYRCPGFKINQDTIPALKKVGYTYLFKMNDIINLKNDHYLQGIKLVNTHSNGIVDDSIEKIFNWLDARLSVWGKDYKFINLEDL